MGRKKCVICYATTESVKSDLNIESTKLSKDTVLNQQLFVIFLLEKVFKTPQDICISLLKEYGNPSEWIDWCNSCSFLVEKAQCVFDQLLLLRKQFDVLQKEFITAVQLSKTRKQSTPEEIEQNDFNCRWGATEIIRKCLTKKQNGNSQSEVEFKIENVKEELDILDVGVESSLFVHDDSFSCENSEINPLGLESEISYSESPSVIKRRSNRMKSSRFLPSNANSWKEVSDNEDGGTNFPKNEEDVSKPEEIPKQNKRNCPLKMKRKKKTFKCEICFNSYATVYILRDHYVSSHGELPFSCDKCKVKMVDEKQMIAHNQKYHNLANTISCPKCITKTFRTEPNLRQHCKRKHPKEYEKMRSRINRTVLTSEDSLGCDKCEARFVSLNSLKGHCRRYHADSFSEMFAKADSKTCKKCNEKCANSRDLKSHYEKEHPKEFKLMYEDKPKKLHPCPHCPFKAVKAYLEDHINTHLNIRPYICDLCGVSFKNNKVLKHHQQSKHYKELGIEPFKCQHCGKMFETPAYLKVHMNTQHLGKFKYHCPVCNRGFIYESYLKIHLQRHQGEKTHLCDECGKSFLTQTILKTHIRTVHNNERPYPCQKCSKTFSSSSRLTRHVQGVHSDGSNPHECQICHKRFPVRNYLYIHMRSHKNKGEVIPPKELENE